MALQRRVRAVRLPDVPLPRVEAGDVALPSKPILPSTVSNRRLRMASVTWSMASELAASTAWAQAWTAVALARTTDGEAVADALRRGRFERFGVPVWFDPKSDAQGRRWPTEAW